MNRYNNQSCLGKNQAIFLTNIKINKKGRLNYITTSYGEYIILLYFEDYPQIDIWANKKEPKTVKYNANTLLANYGMT